MDNGLAELLGLYDKGHISRRQLINRAVSLGMAGVLGLPDHVAARSNDKLDPAESAAPSDPTGPDDGPPGPEVLAIADVFPLAGSTAGGYSITLVGSGFVPGVSVHFGTAPATSVTYVSSSQLSVQVPPATSDGSVTLTVVNLGGETASLSAGFTYVDGDPSGCARVVSISPAAVIEDTSSTLTIRGFGLVDAYNDGFIGLRGPTRASFEVDEVTSEHDPDTGMDMIRLRVHVVATPALDALERMGIQVVASCRAEAAVDQVYETSRHMFAVLPRAVPVPLAYTANLDPDAPSLVVVAGRALEGCTIDVGGSGRVIATSSDDVLVSALVVPDPAVAAQGGGGMILRNPKGVNIGTFVMDAIPAGQFAGDSPPKLPDDAHNLALFSGGSAEQPDYEYAAPNDVPELSLEAVPGQRIVGPTTDDYAVHSVADNTQLANNLLPSWPNFEIVIVDITIIIPILNEVRLVPFFDEGIGTGIGSEVTAVAGELLRVRGFGLLVAIRVTVVITIVVVLVIGFNFDYWPGGLYNEFGSSYPWALGSITIGIRIYIGIFVFASWLVALVQPDGRLRVLSSFNLVLGVDFQLLRDGRQLQFQPQLVHEVSYHGLRPLGSGLQCSEHFLLAEDRGQTVFFDETGRSHSYYFVREPGSCCLAWDFDLELLSFAATESPTVVQSRFEASLCLDAAEAPVRHDVYVTSVPAPNPVPRRLEMDLVDTAALKLVRRRAGDPTAAEIDLRTDGLDPEFFFMNPPQLFEPATMLAGVANPIFGGSNLIQASVGEEPIILNDSTPLRYSNSSVAGFNIVRQLARGQSPQIVVAGLPVTVDDSMATVDVELIGDPIARAEPNDSLPEHSHPISVRVRTLQGNTPPSIEVAATATNMLPVSEPLSKWPHETFAQKRYFSFDPARTYGLPSNRDRVDVSDTQRFFTGTMVAANSTVYEVPLDQSKSDQTVEVAGLTLRANQVERVVNGVLQLVPPATVIDSMGTKQPLQLGVELRVTANASAVIRQRSAVVNIGVENHERWEEYYRVVIEVAELVRTSPLRSHIDSLVDGLLKTKTPAVVMADAGWDLWHDAQSLVEAGSIDDRDLYHVRNTALSAARSMLHRGGSYQPHVIDGLLEIYELESRGIDAAEMRVIFEPSSNGRRILLTGFDPFGFVENPMLSNPSGLAVLAMDRAEVGEPEWRALVGGAILPVRWADMDTGSIENLIRGNVTGSADTVVMILTVSRGPIGSLELDSTAFNQRSVILPDNANALSPSTTGMNLEMMAPPGPTPAYASINRSVSARPIGDTFPASGSGPSWQLAGSTGPSGFFLSNEVFYRVARTRQIHRPGLATGHLHVPAVVNNAAAGPRVVAAVEEIVASLASDAEHLTSLDLTEMPRTRATEQSAAVRVTVHNLTAQTLVIAATSTSPVFSVAASATTVGAGSPVELTLKFSPPAVAAFVGEIVVTSPAGDQLLRFSVHGAGVAANPVITSFDPPLGSAGDLVEVSGDSLDGATMALIGGVPAPIEHASFGTVSLRVPAHGLSGPIQLTTPRGTATSAQVFLVVTSRSRNRAD